MAATRPTGGIGSDLDEALVRAGRYLRKGVVSADLRTLEQAGGAVRIHLASILALTGICFTLSASIAVGVYELLLRLEH